MYKCEICFREFKTSIGLGNHLSRGHKDISMEMYYRKYLMKNENICHICEKYTKFISIGKGFQKYCSKKCMYQSLDIIEKRKNTCLKNFGVKIPFQSNIIKEKIKITNLKIRGVTNVSQANDIKKKKKQTADINNKLNPNRKNEIKEKAKQTRLEKNKLNLNRENEIKEKTKQTCLRRYGVDHISKVEEFQKKKKQSYLKKYGVENPSISLEIKKLKRMKFRDNFLKKFFKYLNNVNLEFLDKEYMNAGFKHNWKCKICKTEFKQIWNYIQQGFQCPKCYPKKDKTFSLAENEIYKFICSLEGKDKIQRNSRNIIKNLKTNYFLELDIYIPDKQIAFEYNGLYWHSEQKSDDPLNRHLQKTNLCEEKGIQLIHIFEDEWIFKKEIVKSKIKQILNINNYNEKINIQNCEIKEISPQEKNKFLEEFHIQGTISSKIKLGAFYKNILISVMTFSKDSLEKNWEINRFCTNSNYYSPGIARKLLSHFKQNYKWNEIFSYIDRRWSQGKVYHELGFELDYISKPNYWYTKDFKRIHKLNLNQKEEFTKIWDCGNLKFKIQNENLESNYI